MFRCAYVLTTCVRVNRMYRARAHVHIRVHIHKTLLHARAYLPQVTDPKDIKLKWKDPDEDKLVQFLSVEKGFQVRAG